jgi:hypothetical protein
LLEDDSATAEAIRVTDTNIAVERREWIWVTHLLFAEQTPDPSKSSLYIPESSELLTLIQGLGKQ